MFARTVTADSRPSNDPPEKMAKKAWVCNGFGPRRRDKAAMTRRYARLVGLDLLVGAGVDRLDAVQKVESVVELGVLALVLGDIGRAPVLLVGHGLVIGILEMAA